MTKLWAILVLGLAALCILTPTVQVRASSLESEVSLWLDAEVGDDSLQQMLLEAEADLATSNQLAGASDADAEQDAEAVVDAELDLDMDVDSERANRMIAKARAIAANGPARNAFALAQKAAAASKAAVPAPLTPRQIQARAQPRAANGRFIPRRAAAPPAAQRPGLFGRIAAASAALGKKVVAGAKAAGAGVKKGLQAVLAKNPKLAAIGAKIGNKLKSISTDIKAKLKAALAKAKTPEEKKKAILEAKKSAKQAKKAAIKVASKAAKKVEVKQKKKELSLKAKLKAGAKKLGKKLGVAGRKLKAGAKKLGAKIKAGAKKLGAKVKAGAKKLGAKVKAGAKKLAKALAGGNKKKLTKAQRKARRAARRAARKARRAARKNQAPRSSSKQPRDAQGRFVNRYKLPVHQKGKLKGKPKSLKSMSEKERKAYKLHKKQSKLAHAALKAAQAKSKITKADWKFEQAKVKALKKKAQALAKKAAKEVKRIHHLRQQAAMGGPKAAAELAQAQIHAAKMQKDAIEAQGTLRSHRNKVKTLKAAHRAQRKVVRDAKANIHENGFDLLLNKVAADVKKLDKSLFGSKVESKLGAGFQKKLTSVEVPSTKYPGEWERKDMEIVSRVPTLNVPILAEMDVPDPARPGFTKRQLTQTIRKVPANPPAATGPVTIETRKEKRPFIGPDGKIIPVDVTYQVATQTVRAKSNGRTPAGFVQQEVKPPAESGLVYKEVTREFPTLINGSIRNLPFKVATWSKTSIILKDVNGRSVASLKLKEVKDGAAPISIQPLRTQPRQVDGKWVVSVIKQVPVKTRRGLMLKNSAIDVPATSSIVAGKAPKFRIHAKKWKAPKTKLKVVLEGVDNSLAQQQARRVALKAVEEDIQDNAINGSISERHLKAGEAAHDEVDRVRENFYPFQDELALKQLIRPEHRFID